MLTSSCCACPLRVPSPASNGTRRLPLRFAPSTPSHASHAAHPHPSRASTLPTVSGVDIKVVEVVQYVVDVLEGVILPVLVHLGAALVRLR